MLTLQTLCFEDLAVGMTERLDKTVASSDVVGFAEVTGDRNPIHLSEHFAAKTPFGTRIAHGLYTASLISAVLGTRLPGPGAVYISQTLNFRAPVKIGDTVEVQRFGRRADPGKIARAADLHLQRRRRNRARRRGLGEGAVEKSRRPPASRGFRPSAARAVQLPGGGAKKQRGVPLAWRACPLCAHNNGWHAVSATGRRREEAARRAIRPLAAPIGAVRRRQRLAVGHDLVHRFLVGRPVRAHCRSRRRHR